ncbi:MAG: hypothetical protein U0X91_25200 [Spirosomataceae bacterium]
MRTKRIILLLIFTSFLQKISAQERISEPVADYQSLQLYEEANWKELLEYGKNTINAGTDFPLLRLRTGYAAFRLGNYSQSLLHYQQVLDNYPDNETALYYVYLNHLYLNNTVMARYYADGFSEETAKELNIKPFRLSAVQVEYSYKMPQTTTRGVAQYGRAGLHLQLGNHIELQQSVAFFNQRISETNFTSVTDNTNIAIQQKEYYAKLLASVGKNWVLIGGFHYQYSPFNNLIYKNTVAFGGIRYYTPYAHFQAMAHVATLANKQFTQFDGTVTAYPLGNTNLYSITRVSYGNQLTLTQLAGVKVVKGLWAEANVTLGSYDILLENDALYIYNDIDTKQLKAGGSLYASLSKNLTLSLNYTFEQKLKIYTTTTSFYQHSLNSGLSWSF